MSVPSMLGLGLSYPMRVDATGAKFVLSSAEQKVREALDRLINVVIGEEPFLVKDGVPYGTRARIAIFEPLDIAEDIIIFDLERAIRVWEPRVELLSVTTKQAHQQPGVSVQQTFSGVSATVSYRYRSTNRFDNLVVPYLRPDRQDPTSLLVQ